MKPLTNLMTAGKIASHLRITRESSLLTGFYALLLLVSALDAYDIGRVPLEWLMQIGAIGGGGYVALRHGLPKPLGYRPFWLFFLWTLLVTAANTGLHNYAALMPAGGTTPYAVFILLRFLTLLSFIATLYLVSWLLQQGPGDQVIRATGHSGNRDLGSDPIPANTFGSACG